MFFYKLDFIITDMTIEIDDSGTGDLIGSAFILFWRRETNDLIKKEVPLELYQSPDFNVATKEFIRTLFVETFKEMKITKTEEIFLCTGSCFDRARDFLKEEEYSFQNAKIEGYLQDMVEQTFLDHLVEEYDVPAHKISVESGKKRFFALYHWVTQDFPRRKIYVKSGFDKWQTKWKTDAETEWMKRMVKLNDYRENNSRRNWRGRPSNHRKPTPKSISQPNTPNEIPQNNTKKSPKNITKKTPKNTNEIPKKTTKKTKKRRFLNRKKKKKPELKSDTSKPKSTSNA
jgi:hypothetical protein